MNYQRPAVRFIQSAALASALPSPAADEFCLLGRSNVGKSSFINHVLENRKLARVSKTPGKTSLANFYAVGDDMIWVDLPGYGYARASHDEKDRWSKLIAGYCSRRSVLKGAIWLLDIRHPGQKADFEAFAWLQQTGLPVFPILTKCDKLTSRLQAKNAREIETLMKLSEKPLCYSIHQHRSRELFWRRFLPWAKQRMESDRR